MKKVKIFMMVVSMFILMNVEVTYAEKEGENTGGKTLRYVGLQFGYAMSAESGSGKVYREDSYSITRMPLTIDMFLDLNAGRGIGAMFKIGYKIYDISGKYSYTPSWSHIEAVGGSAVLDSATYTIKQNLITGEMLLKVGYKDSGLFGDYCGIGLKFLFYGTPTFRKDGNEIKDEKYKDTDVAIYLSIGKRDGLNKFGKIILPASINIGLLLSPGFSEMETANWTSGFFMETKIGVGFNLF